MAATKTPRLHPDMTLPSAVEHLRPLEADIQRVCGLIALLEDALSTQWVERGDRMDHAMFGVLELTCESTLKLRNSFTKAWDDLRAREGLPPGHKPAA